MIKKAAKGLLVALLFFCPLALGTEPLWATITAAVLATVLLCVVWIFIERSGRSFRIPLLGKAVLGLLGFMALQLLPVPPFVLRALSPTANDLYQFTLGRLGHYPAWRSLSLDAPATMLAFGRVATLLLVYLAAVQLSRSKRARRLLLIAVAASGGLIALIGFGHLLFRTESLFGLYRFETIPVFITPFVNTNHLATLLSIGALGALELAWREREQRKRLAWLCLYAPQAIGVFFSLSRGGTVAFLTAHVVFGALAIWNKQETGQREEESRWAPVRALVVPVVAATGLAAAAFFSWEELSDRFGSVDNIDKLKESKLGLVPSFLRMIGDYWVAGVGRGAFAASFPRYQPDSLHSFTHPESWVFQHLCEMGVIAGALFCFVCLATWVRDGLRRDEHVSPGCVAALFAVGLHELVDFGTEFGGVGVPVAILFALMTSRWDIAARNHAKPTWPMRLGLAGLLASVVPAVCFGGMRSLGRDTARLEALRSTPSAMEGFALQAVTRHPADYFIPLLFSSATCEEPTRREQALKWVNTAMFLSPSNPLPHRIAARLLMVAQHFAQARLEYRLALSLGDGAGIDEVGLTFKNPDDLLDAMPPDRKKILTLIDFLDRPGKLETRMAVAKRYTEKNGDDAQVLAKMAHAALQLQRPEEALSYAERAVSRDTNDADVLMQKARVLSYLGRPAEAAPIAEQAIQQRPFDLALAIAAAPIFIQTGAAGRAREWIERSLPNAASGAARASGLAMEAETFVAQGRLQEAEESLRSALATQPDNADIRWRLIALLEQGGQLLEAQHELAELKPPQSVEDRARLEAARERIAKDVASAAVRRGTAKPGAAGGDQEEPPDPSEGEP